MKLTQISQHTFQLTRWPLLFPVNVFLVREHEGFTLVDTAVGGSEKGIIAYAQELGEPITRIALTHAHADHTGALDALHHALPEVEVHMTDQTAQFLTGDLTLRSDREQEKLPGSFKAFHTRPTNLLAPGDRIGSLEIIEAPGHSPDQVAFLDTRDRTLVAGDAFQTRGGVAVSGTLKPLFPFPAMATWNKEVALRTARELRRLSPSHLGVGHGVPLSDPLDAMDRAIHDAEKRLGRQVRHAG